MSKFQHRHYKAVADVLRRHLDEVRANPTILPDRFCTLIDANRCIGILFATMFTEDNPRFDAQRFQDACYGNPRGKDKVK